MTNTLIWIGVAVGIIALLIIIGITMYVKAPPSYAFIISGIKKEPRVLIGTGGFKIPILERLDSVFLGQVTVDVKTNKSVPTHDFINVNVDAVTKVRVTPTEEGIRLAAKNFLNLDESDIARQIQDSLEGNMRECIGSLSLEAINTDRDAFSDQIQKKASPDMEKLGLDILSCNIQNVTDDNNLIRDLGADNTFSIKKNAAITKANAERDIEIAQAEALKQANDVKVKADTDIAERQNQLAIKKAELKKESDTRQAEADAAYEIQKQEQMKEINTKTVDALIEKTKREQILSNEKIRIKENEFKADVNAAADADKYKVSVNAEASLEKQKREAEAHAYNAEQEARAIKAKADAAKYSAIQEAEGIKARGEAEASAKKAFLLAEAEGIRQKGIAEAEAMEKKATAYERYGNVAVIDIVAKMYQNVLPQVAKNVADPMGKIGDITIYGTGSGNEAAGISGNVPVVMKQVFDTVKDSTGIDLQGLVDANSKSAKTDRNISIKGDKNAKDTVKDLLTD